MKYSTMVALLVVSTALLALITNWITNIVRHPPWLKGWRLWSVVGLLIVMIIGLTVAVNTAEDADSGNRKGAAVPSQSSTPKRTSIALASFGNQNADKSIQSAIDSALVGVPDSQLILLRKEAGSAAEAEKMLKESGAAVLVYGFVNASGLIEINGLGHGLDDVTAFGPGVRGRPFIASHDLDRSIAVARFELEVGQSIAFVGLTYVGFAEMVNGDLPRAVDLYTRAIAAASGMASPGVNVWSVYAHRGYSRWLSSGGSQGAVEDIDLALKHENSLQPQVRANSHTLRANHRSAKGDRAGAIKDLAEAFRLAPSPSAAMNLSDLEFRAGNWANAKAVAEKGLALMANPPLGGQDQLEAQWLHFLHGQSAFKLSGDPIHLAEVERVADTTDNPAVKSEALAQLGDSFIQLGHGELVVGHKPFAKKYLTQSIAFYSRSLAIDNLELVREQKQKAEWFLSMVDE